MGLKVWALDAPSNRGTSTTGGWASRP